MADPFAAPSNPGRDSVTLSIVEIDLSTLESLRFPTYRVVKRFSWLGENHLTVSAQLKSLAKLWSPLEIVMDATGVGEGLWAMLDQDFHYRLRPVKYNARIKSDIGYAFLSIINTGRFHDCAPDPRVEAQYRHCQAETLIGPSKALRWGVPDGRRGPDGQLVHDDYLMADSLVAILDGLDWSISSPSTLIPSVDPLERMSHIKDFDWKELKGFGY